MRHLFQTLLVGLALVVIALLSALATMRLAIHGAEVRVPDMSNMTIVQALDQAHDLGLQLDIADHFYSTSTPAGHILNQRPKAGTLVRRSWRVRVTESLGPQNVTIPNVLSMDARLATLTIRRDGLQLGDVTSLPYGDAPAGTVIAQSPMEHATEIERPRVDLLLVAPLPATTSAYAMPNLMGEPYTQAAFAIMNAGFKLAPLETANTSSTPPVPSGTVIGQAPEPSSRIEAGATIQLTVQP